MHVAPWAEEPVTAELPGILQRLRGEWPCVPFGYAVTDPTAPAEWARLNGPSEPDEEIHGHSSNHPWTWEESDGASLRLSIDYPAGKPGEAAGPNHHAGPERPGRRHRAPHRNQGRLPPAARPASDLPPPDRSRRCPYRTRGLRRGPHLSRHRRAVRAALRDRSRVLLAEGCARPRRRQRSMRAGCRSPTTPKSCCSSTASTAASRSPTRPRAIASGSPGRRSIFRACCSGSPTAAARWRRGTAGISRSAWSRSARPSASVRRSRAPTTRWRRAGTPTARDFAAGEVFTTRYRIEAEAALGRAR